MTSTFRRLRTRIADLQVFESPQTRRRFLVHALVLTVVLVGLTVAADRYLGFLTDAERARAFVRSYGPLAPLVFIGLQVAQVVLAPIPGQVLAVVGGYLFGAWLGTFYNMVGITIGSTIAFWLSRRYGRGYVETIVHDDALARFDAIDDDHARVTLFVLFLLPGFPDDVICFAGGLTKLPLWQLVLIAVVGRTPSFLLVNVLGDLLGTEQYGAAAMLALALIAISIAGYLKRDRIAAALGIDA
jgi:uncharacterized membrane protein YdjX (TVP38/TMEM64 family)